MTARFLATGSVFKTQEPVSQRQREIHALNQRIEQLREELKTAIETQRTNAQIPNITDTRRRRSGKRIAK